MQTYPNSDAASAGFGARLFAYAIDLLVQGIIILILRGFFFFSFLSGEGSLYAKPILFSFTLIDIAAYLVGVSYFVLFTYLSGSTLGKFLFRLKVVSAREERLTFFDVAYRETIGRYLSGFFFAGYIYAACNKKGQGFHDVLCDTRVVYSFSASNKAGVNSNTAEGSYNAEYNTQEDSAYQPYPSSSPYQSIYQAPCQPPDNYED
ncbi:MAG: RDD family protein [Oscillospiraceae bacterium]|nr:RDD family protein [Oscillospiraceae bacterium]